MRAVLIALILFAFPASAQAADPFTVTAPDGTVYRATAAELAHWTDVGLRSGAPRRAARDQAFRLLVSFAWLRGEASERGLAVTHDEVVQELRLQRDGAFSTRRQFRRFLRESGQTIDDLLFRVHMDMLSDRIREQIVAPAIASVTDAVVDAHLAEHGWPRTPERRDIRLVFTRQRSAAVAARRELLTGASWSSVGRRYSVDEELREENGRAPDVGRGFYEPRLERAIFRARARRVVGPVRTRFGYYVLRVTRIHPPRRVPESEARESTRIRLVSEAQEAALDRFVVEYDAKWRGRMVCAPAWRSHDLCGG